MRFEQNVNVYIKSRQTVNLATSFYQNETIHIGFLFFFSMARVEEMFSLDTDRALCGLQFIAFLKSVIWCVVTVSRQ